MRKLSSAKSEPLPVRVWVALVGCSILLVGGHAVAAAQTYQIWEAQAASGNTVLFRSVGEHVLFETRTAGSMVLLMVLGLGLALRGRRVLFLGPVVALSLTPAVISTYQNPSDVTMPVLGNALSVIAFYHGAWISWLETGITMVLVLLPAAVVAQSSLRPRRDYFHAWAIVIVGAPAWLLVYLTVVFAAPEGFLYPWMGTQFALAFALGVAMGFDRPWWPWFLIVLPLLLTHMVTPLLYADGVDAVATVALLLLGATSLPLGRVLRRGWEQNGVTTTVAAQSAR